MRLASRGSEPALQLILDPRRLIRWVFVGRLCLASAIVIAAVANWSDTDSSRPLVALLAFAVSTIVTIISAIYTEVLRKRLGAVFLYLQACFDVLLVTVVVHITNGSSSPLSALYILVIATASLLVPAGRGLLVAALGIVMYFGDAVLGRGSATIAPGVWLQLGVIALVAIVIRYLSAELRESDEGAGLLAAALQQSRLEGDEIAELSASLAHEIRNPLASIRSAVEQIARMPAMTDDQKTLSALVMRESDRLSRRLDESLDVARIRVTRVEQVDLARVARDVTAMVTAHPDRPGKVRVTCVVPDDAPVWMEGDEDLLQRALFNLALNAVQASSVEGEVRIELSRCAAERVPAGMQFEGDAVSLRVIDEGIGIAPEIRDRMFDPFFTTKANGSGLGLAVVHRAIEAHRGRIVVDSSPSGTRFTVVLPAGREEPTVIGAACA